MKPILEFSAEYGDAPPEVRAATCNGVGPAHWPEWARHILDSPILGLGISFRPAADIHDFDYSIGVTEAERIAADKRFGRNMVALVKAYTPWYRPDLRYKRLAITKALYLCVRHGGRKAFYADKQEAIQRIRGSQEKSEAA